MTRDRRNPALRRPSSVVVGLGIAALVAVPPSAGVPAAPPPASAASAPVVAAGPAAEVGEQAPTALSVRLNPVALRESVAPVRPAAAPVPSQAPARGLPRITTTARPGTAAAVAVEFALAQRGLPYVWGGNGPQQGHRGFDCSGLTTYAYKKAGIDLPRTAHTQYYAGPHVPAGAELEPGDLVFYGVPERVHHVGLYIGGGQMVAAPTFGKPVRISYVRYNGDDYLGATRPAAGRDADEGLLSTPELPVVVPPLPSPEVPVAPEEFQAPAVPPEEIVEPPVPAAPLVEGTPETPVGDEEPAARSEGAAEDTGPETTTAPEGPAETGPDDVVAPEPSSADAPPEPSTTPSETGSPAAGEPAGSATAEASEAPVASDPPVVPEAPATSAAPVVPEAPATSEASVPSDEPVAEVGPPVALVLAGSEVAVARAESDENGLPSAPESAGLGALRWSPAEDGRAARAVVALHADGVVPEVGSVVTMRAEDGSVVELTVRSRDVVDGGTAADLAAGRGESTRLVLLVASPDTGEIVVLIAE